MKPEGPKLLRRRGNEVVSFILTTVQHRHASFVPLACRNADAVVISLTKWRRQAVFLGEAGYSETD